MADDDGDRRRKLVEHALRALREADADLASLIAIHQGLLADAQRLSKLATELSHAIAHTEAEVVSARARQHLQELNENFKLMQLEIAQRIDARSREFMLVSNLMKTKHDTAKNSMSNIR